MNVSVPPMTAIGLGFEVESIEQPVQLLRYGASTGLNGSGPYTLRDQAHADAVIAATRAAQGSTDLNIDYDHQVVFAPSVAGRAPAAGWFRRLVANGRGIWAEGVEWTTAARGLIASRDYRFISPYFIHDRAGAVVRIVNAGLTNVPNSDDQTAAASTLLRHDDTTISPDERAIITRLGLSDAAYLAERRSERAEAAAAAASSWQSTGDAISSDERAVITLLRLSDRDYLAARCERAG